MASGTRGKLKEELEGVHRNCEWIKVHCSKCLVLLEPQYESLITGFESLVKVADTLDEFAQDMYSKV